MRIRRVALSILLPMFTLTVFTAFTAIVTFAPGVLAPPADAAPTIGHIETFSGATPGGWASADAPTNPGTGGVGGAGDGFLDMALTTAGHLGARSTDSTYIGDWMAANVNRIKFWLDERDANHDLEIHLCIGNENNFWESNLGFVPPTNAWSQFSIDLADSTRFTHIINFAGGFASALQNADRILFRHDKAPFVMAPDLVTGEFGLDNVELTNPLVDVPRAPVAALSPVRLAPPFPNPSRGTVACAFDAFDDAPVTVTVIDARGRRVHAETLAGTAPGRRTWMWNGIDDGGRTALSGVYRVRVVGKAGGMSRPFVIVR